MGTVRSSNGRVLLGRRLRELRKRQAKTLSDISTVTGLSKPTLSKIENGAVAVSYDNLMKLATSLAIDITELFAQGGGPEAPSNGRRSVTRRGTGEIYETKQYRYEMLCTDINPKKLFPILATLRAHATSAAVELTGHPGEEFAFVLEGMVEVRCEFYSPLQLKAGDSIYFDSTMKHALLSAGDTDARILWIATSALPSSDTAPAATRKHGKRLRGA